MKNHLICVVLVCSLIEKVFAQHEHNMPGYTVEEYEDEMTTQDTDIHRPCAVTDVLCIRNYLAAHSDCEIATGPVPNPLYTQQQNAYAPTFNLSVVQTMIYSNGINGSVSEFYVNRKSKLTVLAIDYGEILQNTIAYIRFYGKATEPLVTKTFAELTMPSTVTTTVFRGVDHLSLANSETHISYPIEPALRFTEGSNPVGVALLTARLATRSITELFTEARVASGSYFAASVIQFGICDFGLNID